MTAVVLMFIAVNEDDVVVGRDNLMIQILGTA